MPHMKTKNKNKSSSPRRARRVRFAGIGEAAAALGVERTHLWRVLTGQRQSRSLLARYEALDKLAQ